MIVLIWSSCLWCCALWLVLLSLYSVWVCSCVCFFLFFFFLKLIGCHVTGVLCNSLLLGPGLLTHFGTDYSAFAFVPVPYIVISFPLSFAGAGSQEQRCHWLSRSSADWWWRLLLWEPHRGSCLPAACSLFSQPAYGLPVQWICEHLNRLLWRLQRDLWGCPRCWGVSCSEWQKTRVLLMLKLSPLPQLLFLHKAYFVGAFFFKPINPCICKYFHDAVFLCVLRIATF